jgi:hypothetical protein
MSLMPRHVRVLFPVLLFAATGCGGGDVVLPSEGVAAKIVVLSGSGQTGVAGQPLADSLVVRVTDSRDRPVQTQQVTFIAGDAKSGQPVPPTSTTNADGRAGVKWVLGAVAGPQTMVAKPTGNAAPANLSVTFTATGSSAVPAKLDKVAGDAQTATAGTAVATAPSVKVSDASGNPVAGVAVSFAVAIGGGSVNPTTPVATNAAGVASLTSWTLGSTAGPNTLTATIPGTGVIGNPATFTATGVAGSAGQLAIIQQPSITAQSGAPFAQQPKLQVEDAKGNPVKTAGIAVTAALASGTGGTLGGQLTVATDNKGIATFNSLAITGTQGSYTLGFTNPTLSGATSTPITLAAGAAAQLAITTQPPSSAQSGVVFSQHPVVQLQDAQGNPVAQAGVAVTAALASGSGSLGGTITVNTDGTGSATFTDLAITGPTGQYTMRFTALGLTPTVPSTIIAIGAGVATKLAFTQEPSNVTAGAHITPGVQVTIEDGSGNVVSSATDPVTIAIGTNPGGGTLSGTLTVAAAGGVATFSDLSINKAGNGYTLAATSGSLTGATSSPFDVTAGAANKLVFITEPSNVAVGATMSPAVRVQVQDASGNPVLLASNSILLSLSGGAGGAALGGTNPVSAFLGVATFSNLTVDKVGSNYLLTASSSGLTSGGSTAFNVTAAATTTTVSDNPSSPTVVGQPITMNYSVTVNPPGSGVPTGTVTVNDETGDSCSNPVGAGSCQLTPTTAGGKTLVGVYSGDANFATSTSSGNSHSVSKANTTTTSGVPGSSVVGQSYTVTFNVSVNAPGSGTPTGTVNVSDGAGGSCSNPVSVGNCSLTSTTAGTKSVVASYVGDGNFNASASAGATQNVGQANTTTTITSDLSASTTTADPIPVNYAVSVQSPGTGTPTGSVTVSLDSGESCTGSVAGDGTGGCTIAAPITAGSRTVTATYAGDSSFAGSPSTPVSHTVTP